MCVCKKIVLASTSSILTKNKTYVYIQLYNSNTNINQSHKDDIKNVHVSENSVLSFSKKKTHKNNQRHKTYAKT